MATMAIYLCLVVLITNYVHKIEQTSIGAISVIIRQKSVSMRRLLIKPAATVCHRTARRYGPAVALHQSPGVVFHSGDRLRLAVLRDVQVKPVGAVRKQQHIVYRVPARSTMRFRCDLQTCAVTVDGSRLDDDGPRGSTRPVSG